MKLCQVMFRVDISKSFFIQSPVRHWSSGDLVTAPNRQFKNHHGQCSQVHGVSWNCSGQSWELDLMIPMGLFQLWLFCDSVL